MNIFCKKFKKIVALVYAGGDGTFLIHGTPRALVLTGYVFIAIWN